MGGAWQGCGQAHGDQLEVGVLLDLATATHSRHTGPEPCVRALIIIIIKAAHSEEHASNRRRTRTTQNLGPQLNYL